MKRKMTLQEACELAPDDLPDGAYWAMAHEIAGAEYGEAWDELDSFPGATCPVCGKKFSKDSSMEQHKRDKHTEPKT